VRNPIIRDPAPRDFPAISDIIRHAFDGNDEADLVERLRRDGDMLFELVADADGALRGHIAYSRLQIDRDEGALDAAALAPVAVLPAFQRQGTGTALIEAGNARCRELGCPAIVVLGHASYYPRFGFSAETAKPLSAPFAGPSFMALELQPNALKSGGRVRYAKAFGV
jgi:putative acetyltransferase